jgi:hypothetical protein
MLVSAQPLASSRAFARATRIPTVLVTFEFFVFFVVKAIWRSNQF